MIYMHYKTRHWKEDFSKYWTIGYFLVLFNEMILYLLVILLTEVGGKFAL